MISLVLAVALSPTPEMARLLHALSGTWSVNERLERAELSRGGTRQGIAVFREGPGVSMIQEFHSNGSAGELRGFGVIWWDTNAGLFRDFLCFNNDGCLVRGTAKWEGNNFVNRWTEHDNGKTVVFSDSFVIHSPTSFTLISEGKAHGNRVWYVTDDCTKTGPPRDILTMPQSRR